MSAPGSLDPRRHYAGGQLSEMERKMQIVMGQSSGSGDEEEGREDEEASFRTEEEPKEATFCFSTLPTELIDRILHLAVYDSFSSHSFSSASSTQDAYQESLRLREAAKLCLVCRQFDQLTRPKMYRRVVLSTRKIRPFLHALKKNPHLAMMIRDLTMDSRIWTDVNENDIAAVFLAVRRYCIRIKVGANESLFLPYLFHGDPEGLVEYSEGDSRVIDDDGCALQVLDICWRDEVEVQTQWHHGGGASLIFPSMEDLPHPPPSDTLLQLFQHDMAATAAMSWEKSDVHTFPSRSIPRLTHLTLDLYSPAQLNQLFDPTGFFVKTLLPGLKFLRVEMPLVVLQFRCEEAGGLVHGWPRDDWAVSTRTVQEAIDDRQDQTRRVGAATVATTDVNQPQQNNPLEDIRRESDDAGRKTENNEDEDDIMIMPYCPVNQLKSLTLRFLLNVHRNDMTLFKLLIPDRALQHSWSTRASVTAQCLSSTMQKHFNPESHSPDTIYFPFGAYKSRGPETYWREKWEQAGTDLIASLPAELRGTAADDPLQTMTGRTSVSLLLKWPNAVDAFFHYSAMI